MVSSHDRNDGAQRLSLAVNFPRAFLLFLVNLVNLLNLLWLQFEPQARHESGFLVPLFFSR